MRKRTLPRIHTGLVEGLVQVRILAKTQPNLTSYGWQFVISHWNKVLHFSTIARELRLGFRKDSDLNQTLNQLRANSLLAQVNLSLNAATQLAIARSLQRPCQPPCWDPQWDGKQNMLPCMLVN